MGIKILKRQPAVRWNSAKMEYEPHKRHKPGPKKSGRATERDSYVPGRTRGPGVKAQEKKAALAAFVAAGVPKQEALVMAGYSHLTLK